MRTLCQHDASRSPSHRCSWAARKHFRPHTYSEQVCDSGKSSLRMVPVQNATSAFLGTKVITLQVKPVKLMAIPSTGLAPRLQKHASFTKVKHKRLFSPRHAPYSGQHRRLPTPQLRGRTQQPAHSSQQELPFRGTYSFPPAKTLPPREAAKGPPNAHANPPPPPRLSSGPDGRVRSRQCRRRAPGPGGGHQDPAPRPERRHACALAAARAAARRQGQPRPISERGVRASGGAGQEPRAVMLLVVT